MRKKKTTPIIDPDDMTKQVNKDRREREWNQRRIDNFLTADHLLSSAGRKIDGAIEDLGNANLAMGLNYSRMWGGSFKGLDWETLETPRRLLFDTLTKLEGICGLVVQAVTLAQKSRRQLSK